MKINIFTKTNYNIHVFIYYVPIYYIIVTVDSKLQIYKKKYTIIDYQLYSKPYSINYNEELNT